MSKSTAGIPLDTADPVHVPSPEMGDAESIQSDDNGSQLEAATQEGSGNLSETMSCPDITQYRIILHTLVSDGLLSSAEALLKDLRSKHGDAALEALQPIPEELSAVLGHSRRPIDLTMSEDGPVQVGLAPDALVDTQHLDVDLSLYEADGSYHEVPPLTFKNLAPSVAAHHVQASHVADRIITRAVFSPDGTHIVLSDTRGTLTVHNVNKILENKIIRGEIDTFSVKGQIHSMVFHAIDPVVIVATSQGRIYFFDRNNEQKVIRDNDAVFSIDVHPGGKYLLVGGDCPYPKVYDTTTFQCYVSQYIHEQIELISHAADSTGASVDEHGVHIGKTNTSDSFSDHGPKPTSLLSDAHQLPTLSSLNLHTQPITVVKYSNFAKTFATASIDGSIILWNASNGAPVRVILNAHQGFEITSLMFSPNDLFLLSFGRDNIARLFDLSRGELVVQYDGCLNQTGKGSAWFSYDALHVIVTNEAASGVEIYSAHAGTKLSKTSDSFFRSLKEPSLTASAYASYRDILFLAGGEQGVPHTNYKFASPSEHPLVDKAAALSSDAK